MALTVTPDLAVITTAESITGWSAIGAQSPALEPDFWVQGTSPTAGNCISRAVSGAGTEKGMVFDFGSGIDFTTGTHKDKLVYIWMRCNTPQLIQTRASLGLKVRLCTTSATSNYREWYVDGSDTISAADGWICYVVDPQSTGSLTSGSYSAASVRFYGGSMTTTTTAKGQNFGIDQISYGRGELVITGTVTTAGEGFKEISAATWGDATKRYGVVTEKNGIFYVKGKIILGDNVGTASLTFSSRGETVVFETPDYRDGSGNILKQIPDASVGATAGNDGSTAYCGLAIVGNTTGTTTVDIGLIVGSDNGRSGSTFASYKNARLTTPGRTRAGIIVGDTAQNVSIYGSTFRGLEGAIDLRGTNVASDDCFGNTFAECGRIDSNMEIRNCNIINSVAAVDDGAYIWKSDTNLQTCLFAGASRAVVFESNTGTPFTFTSVTFSGNTFDVRNESTGAITINIINGTTPTYEDIGGGSATTLVINPVTTTITVKDATSGAVVTSARVLILASDGTGPMPYQKSTTITRSGATATATCTAHGLIDGKQALIAGAAQEEYNGIKTVTVTGVNTFTFTVSGTPTTPATGTIVTTGVLISGTTDGSGVITDIRSHAAAQPVAGRIRRSTAASGTLYKTGTFTGTVSNTTGFSTIVQLIRDE